MRKELDIYLVEKYPKIFKNRYADIKKTSMGFGFQHNDGWFWLLDQLCDSIQKYIDNNNEYNEKKISQVIATSVKEKFGMLSFNYYNGNDYIDGMVMMAERMSRNTCEFCGSIHNVGSTNGGWIYTICKECYTNTTNVMISNLQWKEEDNSGLLIDALELRKLKLDKLNRDVEES